MSTIAPPVRDLNPIPPAPLPMAVPPPGPVERAPTPWGLALRSGRVVIGGSTLLAIVLACIATMPWTLHTPPGQSAVFEQQDTHTVRHGPTRQVVGWFGYDGVGRSLFARCLLGGTISLAVGAAAATISVVLGVTVGIIAGYRGGWIDSLLMRSVDVLYGLPYILLVILFKIAFERPLTEGVERWTFFKAVLLLACLFGMLVCLSLPRGARLAAFLALAGLLAIDVVLLALGKPATNPPLFVSFDAQTTNLVVLFSAIGLVSWLTMARVVRGQVLSLRGQPFIEACLAMGLPQRRIFLRHILPNLVGPITVYATLTVPSAILQESFLSFLGVGVNPPLPTWGSLASDAVNSLSPVRVYWWMLFFPCALLALTLLSLNFLGDGLRDVFDPKREAAKI
jgi:oligopeptide transport system permease protein